MSNTLKTTFAAIIIAAVVAFGVSSANKATLPTGILRDSGAVQGSPSFGATAASFATTLFSHLSNLQINGNFNVIGIAGQGADGNTGIVLETQVVTGSCAGSATSTQFAIQNPYTATSTVTQGVLSGQNAGRISDFLVGTSTAAGVTATSTLNGTGAGAYIGISAIPSGAQFYSVAGLTAGTPNSAGGGPYKTNGGVTLGPKDWLIGYATSTAATGGNGVTSCTYKFEIQN